MSVAPETIALFFTDLSFADRPILSVPFHYSHFRLTDIATITCQVCSLPSTTIFDFFRPKQSTPIIEGVKEKFDEFLNQTCKQLTITIYVSEQRRSEWRKFSLMLQLSETSLFGTYVCRARNALGINHAEFTLKGWEKKGKFQRVRCVISSSSEFIQSTKQMKYVTARRPLSTLFMVVNSSLATIEQQKKSCQLPFLHRLAEITTFFFSSTVFTLEFDHTARQEPFVVPRRIHRPASPRPAHHDQLTDDWREWCSFIFSLVLVFATVMRKDLLENELGSFLLWFT